MKISKCVVPFFMTVVGITAASLSTAYAQDYPAKAVRIIVPFAAGGSNDVVGRIVGNKLSAALGQPFVIENRPGASGTMGADFVARSKPDGYTLLVSSGTPLAASPHLYKSLPYVPARDFTPIVRIATQSAVLMVNSDSKISDVASLIKRAKAKPGTLTYGSSGIGSTEHIATAQFMMKTGTDMLHVPYKGTAPAITDLIGGQIDLIFVPVPTAVPQMKSDRLKALGVTSRIRSSSLPDVPTIEEAGLSNFEALTWIGLVGPAGMPQKAVDVLNETVKKAFSGKGASELTALGLESATDTPQEFKAFIAKDSNDYAAIIKAAGIPLQ